MYQEIALTSHKVDDAGVDAQRYSSHGNYVTEHFGNKVSRDAIESRCALVS